MAGWASYRHFRAPLPTLVALRDVSRYAVRKWSKAPLTIYTGKRRPGGYGKLMSNRVNALRLISPRARARGQKAFCPGAHA